MSKIFVYDLMTISKVLILIIGQNNKNKVAHKDVMKSLSEQFSAIKLDKLNN